MNMADIGEFAHRVATRFCESQERIQERFKIATTALDGKVRLEIKDGLKFVTAVAEAMPGMIQSVSIRKPTLDDVFISRTGHRFWTEQEQDSGRANLTTDKHR